MTESTVLEYASGDKTMKSRLALPAGDGPAPAVIVLPHAHGLGKQAIGTAEKLADLGYLALGADYWGNGDYYVSAEENLGPFMEFANNPNLMRARIKAGLDALLAQPRCDRTRVAAIGYCLGGQCAIELARMGEDLKAVVSFHGLLKTDKPARKGEVKPEIAVYTGVKDPFVPVADVETFRQEMDAAEANYQVTIFSDGYHSFTDPHNNPNNDTPGQKYDPLLDKMSWAATVAMLEELLG